VKKEEQTDEQTGAIIKSSQRKVKVRGIAVREKGEEPGERSPLAPAPPGSGGEGFVSWPAR
jgi:hypothetical protein